MATINLGSIKFNWKGVYAGGTAYVIDDVVSYNGSSYVCIQASTGNLPTVTTHWNIMSSAGTNGTDGTDVGTTLTTQGDILYRDGSGLQRLPKGTAGKALLMNSSANAPEWGDAGGGLVQVVSTTKNDTWSSSGTGNFQAVTGLSVTITPSATSSKILILSATQLYTNDYGGGISLYRGGSQLVNPSSPASRGIVNANNYVGNTHSMSNLSINYLDAPASTSALTYQIYVFARSGTYHVNRSSQDTNNDDHARTISTITAMEVSV